MATGGNEIDTSAAEAYEAFIVSAIFRPWAEFIVEAAAPKAVEHWSLTTLREKLVKIGAKVVSHGRYVTF